MKSEKLNLTCPYEAPLCETEVCPQEGLCAESYGSTTENYTDGGDFTW